MIAQPLSILCLIAGASARSIHYDTKSADFSKYGGLYQSVYNEKTGKIFLTNSVGRPPVNKTDLIEVNPTDLTVTQEVQPAFDHNNKTNQRWAVYGIDVDNQKDLIWVTETRQGSVAYYNAADMSLGNQYPANIQTAPRDVYVDANTNLAWVSSSTSDVVDIFSADKKDDTYARVNMTEKIGKPFKGVMSLVADEADKVLYTVSLQSNMAAGINLNDYSVKSWDLGNNAGSPSGVAWDTKRKHLFIANQKTNNTLVLEPSSGKIVKDIKLPGGPLNARYDPKFDVVYVACRTGHTVSVIDAEDFSVITELSVQTPNQISVGPNGEVFVTDKSSSSLFYKFTPSNANSTGSSNSTSSGKTNSSSTTSVQHVNGAASLSIPVAAGVIGGMALLI